MTTLKVHGHPRSSNTRRVLLVLKEKEIPYELIQSEWSAAEHTEPAWLEAHPFGLMPYLDDNGFKVFESRAIARYLVAAYPAKGPALVPAASAGAKALAAFEQAAAVEASTFNPLLEGILHERFVKPFQGGTTDETVVAPLITLLEEKLPGYERILSKTKYLAGDEITLADLFHIPLLNFFVPARLDMLTNEDKAKKWPHVVKWAEELLARESTKATAVQ
ncbi:glutathione transferase [Mycena alexandri]|uniref:glutathione transferase n=1 Tax=Mycena alexandri TaxID=1745969 RepID=A0AAD6TC85_9AGAR|nr:glutathione transferase [Mycena alexandri]